MSSNIVLLCEKLKSTHDTNNTRRATDLLREIGRYFNDRLSENELDLAIKTTLCASGGIMGFLMKTVILKGKAFKDQNVIGLEQISRIIEMHPKKIAPYAVDIIKICLRFLHGLDISAKEREQSCVVMDLLVSKNCCESVEREHLLRELIRYAQNSKPGIVQSAVLKLVGNLVKDYPDSMENELQGIQIRDMFFKTLESAVINRQDTAFVSLSAAFSGLDNLLQHFEPSEEHCKEFASRVYLCIKPMGMPIDKTVKVVNRSALQLLANRSHLFSEQIFQDFDYWHKLLHDTWLKTKNADTVQTAILLLHAIYTTLSSNQLTTAHDHDRYRQILIKLQLCFKTTLQNTESEDFERRLAVVGIGLLASAFEKLLPHQLLHDLFDIVLQLTGKEAKEIRNATTKVKPEYFPDYIEALSKILEQIPEMTVGQLTTFNNIALSVIENFHLLSSSHHDRTVDTLMRSFHNMNKLGDSVLDDVLATIIYNGVNYTISHRLPFEAEGGVETYKTFLPLWNGLISLVECESYKRNVIASKIYDKLISTWLRIMNKLNLSVRRRVYRDEDGKDLELFFNDPKLYFEAEDMKQLHSFINLVFFYRDLLSAQTVDNHRRNFLKWINQIIEALITKAFQHPLLSGFINLLQTVLEIANRLDYFGNSLYEDNETHYSDVYVCLSTMITKTRHSDGEMKIACLNLLFTAPTCMLRSLITDMIPVFQAAFEIGKSNTSLFIAEKGFEAMKRYLGVTSQTSNEANELLHAILPYLEVYLQGFKNETIKSYEAGSKRTAGKLVKVKESKLMSFQKQIIVFLGSLEPESCQLLIKNNEGMSLTKWSTAKTINLTMFGPNFHPKICLDTLIPRICDIATSTTDRQKKMSACEIIQSCILYLLGSNKFDGKLWSELCQLMLVLGCDDDVGIRQMFEPLVMQTMHYLSRSEQLKCAGAEILLQCLMNTIAHPRNRAVRDLASRSLREFLAWAFRQSDGAQIANSMISIPSLMNRLKELNYDSQEEKRIGAAFAFNNIYSVLREAQADVDKYLLDLLHGFSLNYKLTEQQHGRKVNDPVELQHVSTSLDHIVRIIQERQHILNELDDTGEWPQDRQRPLFREAVIGLLQECKTPADNYRKKVMEMILALTPCLRDCDSLEQLLDSIDVGEEYRLGSIVKICECDISITSLQQSSMLPWLQRLHAALDCYIFMITNCATLRTESFLCSGNIFPSLMHYIGNIMNQKVEVSAETSIIEKESIDLEKAALLPLLLEFLVNVMKIYIPMDFCMQSEFGWMIASAIFCPKSLECDTSDPVYLAKILPCIESFLIHVFQFSSEEYKLKLTNSLVSNATETYNNFLDEIGNIFERTVIWPSDVSALKGVDFIYTLFRTVDMPLSEELRTRLYSSQSEVIHKIFTGITENCADVYHIKEILPDALQFVDQLLRVSLYSDETCVTLINLLTCRMTVIISPTNSTADDISIDLGKHFLNLFKSTVLAFFMNKAQIAVNHLISKLEPINERYVLNILTELVQYIKQNSDDEALHETVLTMLLAKWPELSQNADNESSTTNNLLKLASNFAILSLRLYEVSQRAEGFEQWILDIINSVIDDKENKTRAICLIPCIIGPTHFEHTAVQTTLQKFHKRYFPLYTSELRPGSTQFITFEHLFETLLNTMCVSKSPVMLDFIITSTSQDTQHIMDDKITKAVQQFMTDNPTEVQLHCLRSAFDKFKTGGYDAAIRTTLMNRFLWTMLMYATKEAITKFYEEFIRKIEELLETDYNLQLSEYRLQQAFTSRIGGLQLLEVMVLAIPRDELRNKSNPIVIAKFGNDVKNDAELLRWVSNKAVSSKNEVFQSPQETHMEWFRKYQCAAFKLVCSFISNIQDKLIYYERWVFVEKNWPNLVNTRDANLYVNQPIAADKKPQFKARLVSIRRSKVSEYMPPRREFVMSLNVCEPSFSQSVMDIDFNRTYVRTDEEVERQKQLANYQAKTITLQKNPVNDHEVMATLCAVIQHMFEEGITPINEDGTCRVNKYAWVEHIRHCITSNTVHMNIRVLLVSVVDVCRRQFANYAHAVGPAVLAFLVDWTAKVRTIDALTFSLVLNLIEWDAVYRLRDESDHQLANTLIENLMKYGQDQNQESMRRNLQLVQHLLDIWREFVRVPHQFLYEKICNGNAESKSNIYGIQLNAAVLSNDIVPWTDELQLAFVQAVIIALDNEHSDVYQPAAQVLGMTLRQIITKQNNGNIDVQMEGMLKELKANLGKWQSKNEKKFMYVLYYIDKYYVINEFITAICSLIASSIGNVKKIYLQLFLSRVDGAEERDIEIILTDLFGKSLDHQHHLIGLHIFNKALPKLSKVQVNHLLPLVASFHDAQRKESRDVLNEIMKYIREHFGDEKHLNATATDILLKGLSDMDKDVQNTVFTYWNELPELPAALNARVLYMLRHMYNPDFLRYAVPLLFDLKYKDLKERLLRDRAEEDDFKYTEYNINTDSKAQNETFTVPLFVDSRPKQTNDSVASIQCEIKATPRATEFNPTLDPAIVYRSSASFTLQSQSTLANDRPLEVLNRRSERVEPESALRNKFRQNKWILPRRNQSVRRTYKYNIEEINKETGVIVYRRYRFGEYPDFFINTLAFLMPLQGLVKLDTVLARNTFVAIVNAVYQELEDKPAFSNELATVVEDIIKQTNQCDPMFFSALTEIILTNSANVKIEVGIASAIPRTNDTMINALLLLEAQLMNTDANSATWAELANMYYSLHEYDVASSIFADKIHANEQLSAAIEMESIGKYQTALDIYMNIINENIDQPEPSLLQKYVTDFAYQSLFNCYEVMGQWEELENNVIQQLTDDDDPNIVHYEQLWMDEWNKKYLLPLYIRSELRSLMYTAENVTNRAFRANIEQWMRNTERAVFIKKHFGDQLSSLYLLTRDYLQAKVCAGQYFEGFLNEWNAMSVLSDKIRNEKLMSTRRVAEMHGYAEMLSRHVYEEHMDALAQRLIHTKINKYDSSQMWEALAPNRIVVSEYGIQKCPQSLPNMVEGMFNLLYKLNELAFQQQNFPLAKTVLHRLTSFQNIYGQYSVRNGLRFTLAQYKLEQMRWADCDQNEARDAFEHILDLLPQLQQFEDTHSEVLDDNPDIQLMVWNQFTEVVQHCMALMNRSAPSPAAVAKLVALTDTGEYDNATTNLQRLELLGFRMSNRIFTYGGIFERGIQYKPAGSPSIPLYFSSIGEAYYKASLFALNAWKHGSKCLNSSEQTAFLLTTILSGMRFDTDAHLHFPQLMQLKGIELLEMVSQFNLMVKKVPLWKLLMWTPQIVSNFNFESECFLDELLLSLSVAYPNAVVYPFKFALTQYLNGQSVDTARPVVQEILQNATGNDATENFIGSLDCLNLPEKVIQHHLYTALNYLNQNKDCHNELLTGFNNVYRNKLRGASAGNVLSLRQEFSALLDMQEPVQLKAAVDELLKRARKVNYQPTMKLDLYSPWLTQYHACTRLDCIELPGQYTGRTPPNLSKMIKIIKFDNNLEIFNSLRKPIKLTVLCSDGKTRNFLVKYGEDLRQDERIQQLQTIMSEQLKSDRKCRQQNLSVRTYNVIPLNVNCGIISWIENTDSIQSFLNTQVPQWQSANRKARDQFETFISAAPSKNGGERMQLPPNVNAILYFSPEEIAGNLQKVMEMMPRSGLRQALFKLSASPECFFAMRSNFGKSLAVMCIAHWIMGIGDRHLGNFLIDKTNGQLIGIDFNMSFGAATRNLNIPEILPFRLTKQFVEVLSPLQTSGFLQKCMIHVLRTFSLESASLMAALQFFIFEGSSAGARRSPDHSPHTRRSSTSSQDDPSYASGQSTDKECDPNDLVQTVQQKLNGVNPLYLCQCDLNVGYYSGDPHVISAYVKLLNSSPRSKDTAAPRKYRQGLIKRQLTVEEQVKTLIDIATDASVAGVSYVGFQPWI